MHYEFVAELEVTYGNALAAGGGFHRVTTAEGVAAEVAPHTYLWYKLSTEAEPTLESDSAPLAIMNLCFGDENLPCGDDDTWVKLDKAVDRQKGRYLWFRTSQFQPRTSFSEQKTEVMPLKEIRVVRDLKDVPKLFESLDEPLLSVDDVGKEMRTYLCFQRLSSEDLSSSTWSIVNQKVGNWIDIKDLSSNKWSVAQILQHSVSEIRAHIPTWNKGRNEYLSRSTYRNRVAKLGTHTNIYMSPAYPYPRKQGSLWSATLKDLQQAREHFDKYFYDRDKQKTYLQQNLIPFVEKSLLCTFLSSDLTEEMNAFHQHVLKNVIACMLGNDADSVMELMLSLLRMILNGHSSCMFYYVKYPGNYSATKYQRLVYTSYLLTPDALAAIPSRNPCRSLYFIDNVDLFIQAGGFQLILERLASDNIALTEVLLYCTIFNTAKPCLIQHKQRRNSASIRQQSTTEAQSEDFFREFWIATFSRLRRMTEDELKNDDGIIDRIVGALDLLCRDGLLLGSCRTRPDIDDSSALGIMDLTRELEFAEAIEIFHLDLSKKFICCPYLSRRLLSISRINELILMAQRRDTSQKKASLNSRRAPASSTLSAFSTSTSLLNLDNEPMTTWLRSKYIVEWLVSSDFLEIILGDRECCAKYALQEGTHLEILKRSKRIFTFVAAHGLLTEGHIVLMWKTALSQLSSGRKAVFDMLITLCGVLSAEMVDVVVILLTQVAVSDYDELIVDFIKRVIMIASKLVVDMETGGSKLSLTALVTAASGSRNKQSFSAQKDVEVLNKVVSLCCTLYWNAITQTEASGENSIRESMRAGVEIALADSLNFVQKLWISSGHLSSPSGVEQQQLLGDYLRRCAQNIECGTLVETSMRLIELIVRGYGGGSSLATSLVNVNSLPTTSSNLLEKLNTAHNIVSVVVNAITSCVAQSESRSQQSLLDAIMMRLKFLGYIVTNSDLNLSYEAVGILWSCFNAPDSTTEEHKVFFAWFTSVLPDPNNFVHRAYSGHAGLAETVVCEVFRSLTKPDAGTNKEIGASQFCLDVQTMGEESFWALERLFRFVNTSTKRISLAASRRVSHTTNESGGFVVEAMDLEGLETLYDVALLAKSDIVSQQASNYLIYLHLHVGSKLVRREVWTDFVERCFRRLEQEVQTTDGFFKPLVVLRLSVLLSTFLHQSVIHSHGSANGEGAFDGPEELNVHVRTQGGRVAAPFRYHLKRTSLVSELRDRIAKDTGHPADRIRIVNSGKVKLTAQGHGKFTLEKARIFNESVRPSRLHPETLPIKQKSPAISNEAKRISYVEAILLSKVESDTSGHASRSTLDFHGAASAAAAAGIVTGTNTIGSGNNSCLESDWLLVKTEISGNEKWVALLFNLLSYNDGIAEEAWKILKLLPTNESMEKAMRTLNNVLAIDGSFRKKPTSFEWKTLLESDCPPKLLYQLELVEKFALCSDRCNGQDSDEEGNQKVSNLTSESETDDLIGTANFWSASFIELGGQTRLEQFVLSSNLRQLLGQGTLYEMCLSKLLKLLRHFVLIKSKLEEVRNDLPQQNFHQLIRQLLETLSSILAVDKASRIAPSSNLLSNEKSNANTKDFEKPLALTMHTRPQVDDPDNIDKIPSDAYLMTRLLSCIATCALAANQGASAFLETSPDHGDVILRCLVESRFKPVRLEAANAIAALSTVQNKLRADRFACCNYFLQLIGGYTGTVTNEEYYHIFTLLVSSAEDLTNFAILSSCKILCGRIKAFKINDEASAFTASTSIMKESRHLELAKLTPSNQICLSTTDALLEGQLSTLLSIIKRIPAVLADGNLAIPFGRRSLREVVARTLHNEEGIVHELFHECLFATSDLKTSDESQSEGSNVGLFNGQACSKSKYYLRQPKCRSDSCRKIAFDLLKELSVDNTDGLRYLLTQMANQHTLDRPLDPLATPSASKLKRKSAKSINDQLLLRGKYVGLKNLGCTCYLNSTIQSFFMMPRFRRHILRLQASGSETKSLIFELQSLFAHLEGNAKPYYNPRSFTRAIKTWDGETMDVNVQQDASEFLTSFFQQIESEMNGSSANNGEFLTSDESILNTFFGGEFSNELVAEGDRYSERFEPFHFISLPVRDRKNLKESLEGWVQGEKVSYTWEHTCDLKIGENSTFDDSKDETKVTLDTHKRISISKLPAYLIIHLKRFEFDFEKMQQIKLHDRFEFPTELDMYPYTKEGQQIKRRRSVSSVDDGTAAHDVRMRTSSDSTDCRRTTAPEYSQYELVGTVVHLGTAHSGHYYSFLRDQQVPRDTNLWYEFNDKLVKPFDPAQIPEECFGGEESAHSHQNSATKVLSPEADAASSAKMKKRSSFMLFYARVTSSLRLVENEEVSCVSFATIVLVVAFFSRLKRRATEKLAALRRVAQVIAPEPICKLIAMENRLFWRKKYLYNKRCLKFTYHLLRSCLVGFENAKNMAVMPHFEPVEAQFEALQVATKFVLGTLLQGGEVIKLTEWRLILQSLYHSDVEGCRWFLSIMEANESLLLELLIFHENQEVRELMANVISEAIVTTSNAPYEGDAHDRTSSLSMEDQNKKLPASFEFMFFLIQLMPALLSVPVHHHRQYFFTMYDFVQTGRNEGSFLVVNSVVGAIVSLLTGLGNTQPLLQSHLRKHKSKQILKRIDLSVTILKLLSVLIRCSVPPAMDVESSHLNLPTNMAQEPVDLTPADHNVLLNERFITLLTQRANHYTKETKPLEQIICHLCWESRRVSAAFLEKIMHGIEVEDHHDVKPYFRTLNSLLKIRDSLAEERLTDGLTKLVAVMASQQRYYKATETSLDMLTRLAKRHSGVTQWLCSNRQSCMWMEKWLLAHCGAEGYLQQRKTVLIKPNSTSSWVNVSVTSSGLIKAIERSITKLLPRIRSILDPEGVVETFYDSDDNPQRLVGKRVRVKWAKDKWYEGIVQEFNEDTYEHFVVYDDGDKRSYHMSEKLFYVVNLTSSPKSRQRKLQQQQA
ncbi:ubiquitin domain containing protein [Plasmopara halstedii]|uniref:ubiquitinyl hydrolase 1 n=1 Tax=Plasmopara halstedii TaxID=4781 RepID=A0A0N7L401_PLAHL|nr:ubiquitin domain containing protein [Plasmopara halstedii]CEG37299.1 ubiquitin domain containing protein [Plasmopara halstedii]|eukprot:XP_024573668.1 ubiquitin domain containing protein [Plasmopara halstedii]